MIGRFFIPLRGDSTFPQVTALDSLLPGLPELARMRTTTGIPPTSIPVEGHALMSERVPSIIPQAGY